MLKHIVMFRFQMETEQEKNKKLIEFKTVFESLSTKIDVLRHLEVGLNINSNEQFDLVLVTLFDSMQDLEAYTKHPAHVAVGKIIAPYKIERSCVDFLCEK